MAEEKYTKRSLRERIGLTVRSDNPADLVTALVQVEEAGVEQVWVPFGPPWNPDSLTTLAAAAVRTSRLKFGTYIIQVPSRHPVLLAQQVLSFNALAPNRLQLGLGAGSPNFAKSMYGVDIKRVFRGKLILGVADGWLAGDGKRIYEVKDMRVVLFSPAPAG